MVSHEALIDIRKAQERRVRAYAEWEKAFKSAIGSKSSPADFQAVAAVVTEELGSVTTALRHVQQTRTEAVGQGCAESRYVEALQAAEKQRYEATVELQRLLAVHANARVLHDPGCCVIALCSSEQVLVGVSHSGVEASSDDEAEEQGAEHDHQHGHGHGHEGCATQKGNGCRDLAARRSDLLAVITRATGDARDVMEDIQCELSG
jgi:hypothetical protein